MFRVSGSLASVVVNPGPWRTQLTARTQPSSQPGYVQRALGTQSHHYRPRRAWQRGPSCSHRGFWIPKAFIAQHPIWRLKMVLETRNYLKYVFSSFLGREEEKPVSKKLLQVHNSPSEPRSSFHLSLQPVLPSGHDRLHPNPSRASAPHSPP